MPEDKIYRVVLNSDDEKYGGTNFSKRKRYKAIAEEWNGRPQHIEVDICGNSVIFLKAEEKKIKTEGKLKKRKKKKQLKKE